MSGHTLKLVIITHVLVGVMIAASTDAMAVLIPRTPVQGAGFVTVDGGVPLIVGAPVGSPLLLDFVFENMLHIETQPGGATTNIEFSVGNTGNEAPLDFRIVFDLSDMNGDLLTNELFVVEDTAAGGFIQALNLNLIPLPGIIFHDFHIKVETSFQETNTGSGLFDFYVAGGGGGTGTVSGPIVFNSAVVGEWSPVPEPRVALLSLLGFGALFFRLRRRTA